MTIRWERKRKKSKWCKDGWVQSYDLFYLLLYLATKKEDTGPGCGECVGDTSKLKWPFYLFFEKDNMLIKKNTRYVFK